MNFPNLRLLVEFEQVAKYKGFRKAAVALGVSATALSKSIRRLEADLGVRLIQRTTRAVQLTQEGDALLTQVQPALATIGSAIQMLGDRQDGVAGSVRITVPSVAYAQIIEPHLGSFLHQYQKLNVEISIDDGLSDIVTGGFDAGIRLGERLALDMVAVPLGGRERMVVVASPGYLAGRSPVNDVHDLLHHDCIRLRLKTTRATYPWLLKTPDGECPVQVAGRLILDSMPAVVAAAVKGCGVAYTFESVAKPAIERAELVCLLDQHVIEQPGWFMYFPSRQHMSSRLRSFIDFFRSANSQSRTT